MTRADDNDRYDFEAVKRALNDEWGLTLRRGGEMTDLGRDGRWDTAYSKTGFIVGGDLPRRGYGYQRHRSLADVVDAWGLAKPIAEARRR